MEENKSKQEHRQRVKLESSLQDVEEKLDRETNVRGRGSLCVIHFASVASVGIFCLEFDQYVMYYNK